MHSWVVLILLLIFSSLFHQTSFCQFSSLVLGVRASLMHYKWELSDIFVAAISAECYAQDLPFKGNLVFLLLPELTVSLP